MGYPPQSRGGGSCAQRQDHDGGSSASLPTIGGGVPLLAACVRDARPCRLACHARSAIQRAASTASPPLTTLMPPLFCSAPLRHRGEGKLPLRWQQRYRWRHASRHRRRRRSRWPRGRTRRRTGSTPIRPPASNTLLRQAQEGDPDEIFSVLHRPLIRA